MRRHARVHAQPATREGTAHLSGEGTSASDQLQSNVASSSSMPFPRDYNNSSEDNDDDNIASDHYEVKLGQAKSTVTE
jgi:hypothetical protein